MKSPISSTNRKRSRADLSVFQDRMGRFLERHRNLIPLGPEGWWDVLYDEEPDLAEALMRVAASLERIEDEDP